MTIDYSRARVEFNENGYVLIRKFFRSDHIKSIRRDVSNADFLSLGCDTYFESIGDTTTLKRVERFHNKFQPLSDLLRNKQYLALLETLLGETPCLLKTKSISNPAVGLDSSCMSMDIFLADARKRIKILGLAALC